MDFLDPKKERFNRIKLLIGYCLVALAIGIATLILLYQSFGYNLTQGEVTQNGLLFVSSQPTGSAIYLNGQRYKSNTDTRVVVPANTYDLRISAAGYRDWERPVAVNGGDVQHFDYPFLFPQKLKTTELSSFSAAPPLVTQSLDRRWILAADTAKSGSFKEYDLKDPTKPVVSDIALPDGSFTPSEGTNTWTLVEWAADNKHVLLQHSYTNGGVPATEYVLFNRDSPVDSVDLSNALHLPQTASVTLFNNRTDQFFVFDQSAHTLQRVNGSDDSVVSQLNNILAFKTYGSDYILYATDKSPTGKAVAGQVSVVLQAGQKTVTLRTLPAGGTYVLNLAQYSGDWYVAVSANNDTAVYVYKNPQDQPQTGVDNYPQVWRRMPIAGVTFLSFSSNTQFLAAENGQQFMVYDFENIVQYHYKTSQPLDQPQTHATWMDGDRLVYVSGGKLIVFDYDYRNQQTLQAASATYLPYFAPDYSYVYTMTPPTTATGKTSLSSTALTVTQ